MQSAEAAAYHRRRPEDTLLYRVIQEEFAPFQAQASQDGRYLPLFVQDEFHKYLECGQLACGFARVYCAACKNNRLVAYACKRRGFCPSCCGRRMSETAAQLVDHVLPHVPVRQWVLSLPHFLRYRVAYDAALCSEALAIFLDEVFRWYRWEGKRECGLASVADAHAGSVTWIQRFSSSLALNVHFHALVLDGVYLADSASSKPVFRALAAPTQADMLEVVARVHRRVIGLLHKRGLLEDGAPDDLVEAEPLLAACAMASIQGRVAQGERAGSAVERLRTATPVPRSIGTRCVEFEGFNLHANVRIPASERSRLERLCRYVGRPPLANERLGPLSDGRIGYRLKRPWSDGTTFVVFGRQALIEKLVALVPPPRVHQIRYHGVLASHARLRPLIVPEGPERCAVARQQDGCRHYKRFSWADLMQRVFAIDVLVCPKCSGRMSVIATITDRGVARRILQSCGLSQGPPPSFSPARLPQQAAFNYEYVPWDG